MKIAKLVTLIMATAILGSCEKGGVFCHKETGTIISETREHSGFTEIEMRTQADVYVTQADDYSVVVETSDNLQDIIETKVKGDRLIIEEKSGKCIKGNADIKVHVSAPDIDALVLSGSGGIYSNELISAKEMKLKVSGSGTIEAEKLDVEELDMDISGSGEIIVEGTNVTKKQTIKISGSGDVIAINLQADEVVAKISGSGSCEVHPIISLDASIAGSGDILYLGTPAVTTHISGSGDVRPY